MVSWARGAVSILYSICKSQNAWCMADCRFFVSMSKFTLPCFHTRNSTKAAKFRNFMVIKADSNNNEVQTFPVGLTAHLSAGYVDEVHADDGIQMGQTVRSSKTIRLDEKARSVNNGNRNASHPPVAG